MCAKTTVAASADFATDRFWLNGVESEFGQNERLHNCLTAGKQSTLEITRSISTADHSIDCSPPAGRGKGNGSIVAADATAHCVREQFPNGRRTGIECGRLRMSG